MDYEQCKIKKYDHWQLYLHQHQYPYIGRCYAWALRDDAQKIVDMSKGEWEELFGVIIPAWDTAVKELFQHDWPNVACLGNTSPHLHWHLIPRYHSPREFHDMPFIDPNPTGNYAPYPKKELPLELILTIKEEIKKRLYNSGQK